MILVDTSVLIALHSKDSPKLIVLEEFIKKQLFAGNYLTIAPQCIYEFYVVSTRPISSNGLGLMPKAAYVLIDKILENYNIKEDSKEVFDNWLQLVSEYNVSGKPAHDARLVAWMMANGVKQLLTLNPKDFIRYASEVEILSV